MASRCVTDPLDLAVDVCDICSGNYCATHLVESKAHKHPICVECAMAVSGVRHSGPIQKVDDPGTAAERRAELKSAIAEAPPMFVYFDDEARDRSKVSSAATAPAGEGPAQNLPPPPDPPPHGAPPRVPPAAPVAVAPSPTASPPATQAAPVDRLPPLVANKSRMLDQIVVDKQSRAELQASKLAERLRGRPRP